MGWGGEAILMASGRGSQLLKCILKKPFMIQSTPLHTDQPKIPSVLLWGGIVLCGEGRGGLM